MYVCINRSACIYRHKFLDPRPGILHSLRLSSLLGFTITKKVKKCVRSDAFVDLVATFDICPSTDIVGIL